VPDEPRLLWADRFALAAGTLAECQPGSQTGTVVVSCGRPLPDTEVRILPDGPGDPDGDSGGQAAALPLADGKVGEVWISGPQVVLPEPADVVGELPGRRTGDLGFLFQGELFLLGRSHERFQINGENFYGADLELEASAASEHVRAGRVLALADGERSGVEVVAEWNSALAPPTENSMAAAAQQIVARLARRFGVTVSSVRFVTAGTIPLTTSGKVRRHRSVLTNSLDELWTYRRGERT
jgi:acyl-CoA synthetase (AMP-forming)/AMP-acid ligase II